MTEMLSSKIIHAPAIAVAVALLALAMGGCTQGGSQGPTTIPATAFIRSGVPVAHPTTALPSTPAPAPDPVPLNTPITQSSVPTTGTLPSQEANIQAAAVPAAGTNLAVAALLGTVNSKPIFVQDVLRPISKELKNAAAISKTKEYFQQQAEQTIARELNVKIDDILFLAKAKRYLNKDDMKEVAAIVAAKKAKIVAQYMGSEQLADRALRQQGSSLQEKLQGIRNQTIIGMYFNHTIYPKLISTRRQLWHYYQAHIAKYTQHASVDLYTITYRVINQWPRDPNDPTHTQPVAHPTKAQIAVARRKAVAYCDKLESEIRHGANFALLAENNSSDPAADNGGHWPDTRRGELSNPLIEKIAFSLKPHSMAPPLLIKNKTNPRGDAVVIIRVGAVTRHHVIPFGQEQSAIALLLRQRMYQQLLRAYQRNMYDAASVKAMSRMVATASQVATSLYFTH
jgi:hypothetical protein